MSRKYEILEHPADLEIRVRGATKKELFANAMAALADSLRAKTREAPTEEKVRILAKEMNLLLVDFLNEINYLSEVNRALYNRVSFTKFSDTEIVADIYGKEVVHFGLQVKGVTFHGLEVKEREKGGWQATILFDI